MNVIEELQVRLDLFAEERGWRKYHTSKNLVMALAAEAGELLHIFEWLTEEESDDLDLVDFNMARDEMADVFIYLARLADILEVDLIQAAHAKIEKNAVKYPATVGP